MPQNDRYGRAVLYWKLAEMKHGSSLEANDRKSMSRQSIERAVFFVCHAAILSNPDAQRRGVVLLLDFYHFDLHKSMTRRLSKTIATLWNDVLPMNIRAIHAHYTLAGKCVYDLFMPTFKKMLSKRLRLRIVPHCCCQNSFVHKMEVKYGIPCLFDDSEEDATNTSDAACSLPSFFIIGKPIPPTSPRKCKPKLIGSPRTSSAVKSKGLDTASSKRASSYQCRSVVRMRSRSFPTKREDIQHRPKRPQPHSSQHHQHSFPPKAEAARGA